MSERQAKKIRKEQVVEATPVKKDKSKIIFNIVTIVLIVVVAGLGAWSVYDKVGPFTFGGEEQQEQQIPTIADAAAEKGITAEELIAKSGVTSEEITAETPVADFFNSLTIEQFANCEDMDVAEFKKLYEIEDLANDMLWNEAQGKVKMAKMAEIAFGMSFEDFAAQQGLPAEITGDMTQEEALAIMTSTQQN